MRSEIELILLGCLVNRTEAEENRLNELLAAPEDWAFITGQLVRHRLNGNFYASLSKEQTKYMIHKVLNTFGLLSSCYEACNKVNLEFTQKLMEETDKAGLKIAGLKGVVFNTTMYPLGARRSNDIDVLVAENDIKAFDNVMRELGFIQSLDRGKTEATKREKMIQIMNYHDLVPYFKRIELPYMDTIKVDVNFHFDSKDHDITRQILDKGVQEYVGNGYTIRGLKWTSHLLHLCVHFYREASNSIWTSTGRDVDLYKIVDIQNTFRRCSREELLDWCKDIDEFELRKQCYFTLYYLYRFYPEPVYKEVMEKIEPDDTSFLVKVQTAGGQVKSRELDFFDQTFDMTYGKNFTTGDFSKVY